MPVNVGRAKTASATTLPWRLLFVLSVANVGAGVFIAVRPGQSQDLRLVVEWCRQWLIQGINPYPGTDFTTNYPPYAIALLSPLASLSSPMLEVIWAALNAGLALLAAWLGPRLMPSEFRRNSDAMISLGFFLTWESLRVGIGNGQFSLLSLTAGLAAVAYPRYVLRGLLLAIAMIKPQLGLAFCLWAALEGAVGALLVAGIALSLGVILFSIRLGHSVWGTLADYADVLRHQFGGPGFKQGALELRPLLHDLIGRTTLADAIHLTIVAAGFGAIVLARRRMTSLDRSAFLLPLVCLWTLASIYHLSYDLIMLWPVFVALACSQVTGKQRSIRLAGLVAMQTALMVDIPGLWWKLSGRGAPAGNPSAIGTAIQHFDRLLVLTLFVAIIVMSTVRKPRAVASLALPQAVPL